ncbi:peptide chain release factor N(5)-glutamine methyltransferase [Agaribacterium sp. ZY112]|uniref:peptide chain release factor N(5)-glutamine methyltransferase n=1 Tax=Agaribacterium sp. ZY112 TaxID=3233574 RepID=UPI003524910C
MISIACCLKRAAELTESDTARLDVELLLAKCLNKNRSYLFTWPERELDEQQTQAFSSLFERRLNGEPIAYILGQQDFWSLDLKVSPATLIPRPETELLVELALDRGFNDARILDLGTGTGAVALALASEFTAAHVEAVDYSADAVALAAENAKALGLERVLVSQSDWYSNVSGCFDLIVSNPPYIDAGDRHLSQGDVRFEPLSALVSENSGLADLEKIISGAPTFLFESAWLLVEHGWQQAEFVRLLFLKYGFKQVASHRDLAGHERITLGQFI